MPKKLAKKSDKKGEKLKNRIGVSIVVIIVLFVAVVGVILWQLQQKDGTSALSGDVTQVTDEGVTWLPEKQEIKIKEQLFKTTPDGEWGSEITYFKVGNDNGKDIIFAFVPYNGPGSSAKIMLVRDGNTYALLCPHTSVCDQNSIYNGPEFTEFVVQNYQKAFHALLAPRTLQLPQGVLSHVSEFTNMFFFQDYVADDGKEKSMKEFAQTPWGTLFAHTVSDASNFVGKGITLQQYVLKLANGEARTYQMHPQFIADDNVILATWNDGKKNTDVYSWNTTNGGCGASGFVEVLPESEIADLTPVGKTVNGETLYGFKNLDNPTLKGHFSLIIDGYNPETGESIPTTMTIAEYSEKHGVFVYKDSFGRHDVFVNQKYGTGAECGKPVIYLYPTKTTPVSVQVGVSIRISEPDYNNGWNVTANPDGTLINADGKKYTSLFWEGLGHGQYPSVEAGFVVPQADVQRTLWEQTHKLGLNDFEAQEFMNFWMPHMPADPYVRLTWLGTRQMDELAPLTVNPKPDTSIRIFLEFEGQKEMTKVTPQILSAPQRKGFTLVEWGGLLRAGK